MATSAQIATRALRRLRVVAADQTPSAADLAAATDALDAMIAAWEAGALSGDTTPLDSRFEMGLVAMLAERLAGEYGKTPDPILARDAENGRRAIDGAFFVVPVQRFPAGIVYTGQDTTADILFGTIYDDYKAWEASTAYSLRDHVTNGSYIYECTTAGTSGSTGPTGTSSGISDGTCVWTFRRATE